MGRKLRKADITTTVNNYKKSKKKRKKKVKLLSIILDIGTFSMPTCI